MSDRCSYELLSVVVTDKYSAIYRKPAQGRTEEYTLLSIPLDAIGLARLRYEVSKKRTDGSEIVHPEDRRERNVVVGLLLDVQGQWRITDEHENYCGMVKGNVSWRNVVTLFNAGFKVSLPEGLRTQEPNVIDIDSDMGDCVTVLLNKVSKLEDTL